jgi:hypothetical protein
MRQAGHDGDHAAYTFSISEPETWEQKTFDRTIGDSLRARCAPDLRPGC